MFYVWLQISKPYFSTGEECWIWWMRRWWLCGRHKRIFSAPYRSSAFTLIWYSDILNKIKILEIFENFTTIMYFRVYFSFNMDLIFNTVLFSSGMETSFMNRSHKKPLKLHSFFQHCALCDNFSNIQWVLGEGVGGGLGGMLHLITFIFLCIYLCIPRSWYLSDKWFPGSLSESHIFNRNAEQINVLRQF